jgi:hypothetical protein
LKVYFVGLADGPRFAGGSASPFYGAGPREAGGVHFSLDDEPLVAAQSSNGRYVILHRGWTLTEMTVTFGGHLSFRLLYEEESRPLEALGPHYTIL